MKQITEEQINEFAEKEANSILHDDIQNGIYKGGLRIGAKWMQEQLQPEWIPCKHKVVLPTGDYLLRLEYNGFDCNRQFTVSERQKQLEVPYFNVVAYYKVPNYEPPNQ